MADKKLEDAMREHREIERWRARARPGTKDYDDALRALERLEHRLFVLRGGDVPESTRTD